MFIADHYVFGIIQGHIGNQQDKESPAYTRLLFTDENLKNSDSLKIIKVANK
jgi:hypothetical protein